MSSHQPENESKTNYDRMSGWYDWLTIFEEPVRRMGIKMLEVRQGERILEIGSGTGRSLIHLANPLGPSGEVVGVDTSRGMMNVAQRRISRLKDSGRVQLLRADARTLPFPDEHFDAVFMSFTLELFEQEDLYVVLRECKRVLAADGRLCVIAMAARDPLPWMSRAYIRLHGRFPKVIDCRPIKVTELLDRTGFQLDAVKHTAIFGLPVDVVVAHKQN